MKRRTPKPSPNQVSVETVPLGQFQGTAEQATKQLWSKLFPEDVTDTTQELLLAVSGLSDTLRGSRTKVMGHEYHSGEDPAMSILVSRLAAGGYPRNNFLATISKDFLAVMHVADEGLQSGVIDVRRAQDNRVHVNVQDPFRSALESPSSSSHFLYPSVPFLPADLVLQAAIDLHYINRDILRSTQP